jgi:hypothetical protein
VWNYYTITVSNKLGKDPVALFPVGCRTLSGSYERYRTLAEFRSWPQHPAPQCRMPNPFWDSPFVVGIFRLYSAVNRGNDKVDKESIFI